MLPELGTIFEGYELESVLGEGGFAVVYRARETISDRIVALKILTPDSSGGYESRVRARFMREVRVLGSLRAATTIQMYAAAESADGLLWAAFEYVPGRDLSEVLAEEEKLSQEAVIHILRQLCESLAEAHGQGLLHRDIKPANVRVLDGERGSLTVKLLDFGIARSTDDGRPAVTRAGELVGTPRYMSPEQLKHQPLTPRSDIYSLGIMAFELLVGRQALAGNRFNDQINRLLSGHVFAAPELERIGPRLLEVIQRMTAIDPDQRFASIAEVVAALDALEAPVDDATTRKIRPPTTRRPAEAPERRPAKGYIVGVALMLVLVGVVALTMRETPREQPRRAATAPATALLKSVDSPAPDATVSDSAVPDAAGCTMDSRVGFSMLGEHQVYVPSDVEDRVPLVVLMRPNYLDPVAFVRNSAFIDLADEHGFIVVAPEPGESRWVGGDRGLPQVRDAYQRASSELCIDEERVFLASIAGSGRTAQYAACEPWVKGVGYMAYLLPLGGTDRCAAARPTFIVNPRDSKYLVLDGSSGCATPEPKHSLEDMVKLIGKANQCKPASRQTWDRDGGTCERWDCAARLESCHAPGGLAWLYGDIAEVLCPGEPGRSGFPMERAMWDFFASLQTDPDETAR